MRRKWPVYLLCPFEMSNTELQAQKPERKDRYA